MYPSNHQGFLLLMNKATKQEPLQGGSESSQKVQTQLPMHAQWRLVLLHFGVTEGVNRAGRPWHIAQCILRAETV